MEDINKTFQFNQLLRNLSLNSQFLEKAVIPGREGETKEFKDGLYKFTEGHWKKIKEDKNEGDLIKFKTQLEKTNDKLAKYNKQKEDDIAFTTDDKKDYNYQKQFKIYLETAIKKLENKKNV
jgi:hypothetical protein